MSENEQATDSLPEAELDNSAAEEAKAFAEAFDDNSTEAVEAQPQPVAEPAEQQDEQQADPTTEAVLAGLTEQQVTDLFAKAARVDDIEGALTNLERRLFGKLGEFNSKISEIQQQPRSGGLSLEQLKRTAEEYPDLAELLVEDLNAASLAPGQQAFDPNQLNQMVDSRFSEQSKSLDQSVSKQVFNAMQPTWRSDVQTPEFRLWASTLPVAEQQKINSSWDAAYLNTQFNNFKTWRDNAKKSRSRQNTLAANVTPKGSRANPDKNALNEEEAAFLAAFES
jgi:hypothetical protein